MNMNLDLNFQDPQKHEEVKTAVGELCTHLRGSKDLTADILDRELQSLKDRLAVRGIFVTFSADHVEPGTTGYAGLITYELYEKPAVEAKYEITAFSSEKFLKSKNVIDMKALAEAFFGETEIVDILTKKKKDEDPCCEGDKIDFKGTEVCIAPRQDEVVINGIIPDFMTVTTVQSLPAEIQLIAPDDLGHTTATCYLRIPKENVLSNFIRQLARVDNQTGQVTGFRKKLYDKLRRAMTESLKEQFGNDCIDPPWSRRTTFEVDSEKPQNS